MSGLPDKSELLAEIEKYRTLTRARPPGVKIEPVGPGEESVWDFPRPPEVQEVSQTLRVEFAGERVAETAKGLRVVETSGAPVYYFPPSDVAKELLSPVERKTSLCEWKGVAVYYDVVVGAARAREAAFAYPDPLEDLSMGYDRLAGFIAFYASRMDACFIGETRATPQPGGFYAGWVTPRLKGPIKGEPGSEGW